MIEQLQPGKGFPCPTPCQVIQTISYLDFRHFSSFSAAAYDTAWLSMIYIRFEGVVTPQLLFPQCFSRLVNTQQGDGTWGSYGCQGDGVLSTLASLLALIDRRKHMGSHGSDDVTNINERIEKARSGAQALLLSWDISTTVHVGFEILVTNLLKRLASDSVVFEFPASWKLALLYQRKMKGFSPRMIYSENQCTVLHSLEALTGIIDFDKVRHHCNEEIGVFGSPAATAAYLIHARVWDMRAETYLRKVLNIYDNDGKVPSAFPTPIFEISWVCITS
jgi:hypothetical protein